MLYVSGFVITLGYTGLFNYDNQFLFAEKRVNLKNYQPNPKGAVSLRRRSWQNYNIARKVKFCSIRIKNNKESYVNKDMYIYAYAHRYIHKHKLSYWFFF